MDSDSSSFGTNTGQAGGETGGGRPPMDGSGPPVRRRGRGLLKILIIVGAVFGSLFFFFLLVAGTIIALAQGLSEDYDVRGERIAVVEVEGLITDSVQIGRRLAKLEKDSEVKAVILRINSPGGGVGASQELFQDVERLRVHKVVVASLGPIAASGAYYIASAANSIVASPGTITGSVGVVSQTTQLNRLLARIGVDTTVLASGEHKDSGSPLREMGPSDVELFEGLVSELFEQFISDVRKWRELDDAAVEHISDGRILSGRQALQLGLVDQMGNMRSAEDEARKLASLDESIPVAYPTRPRTPLLFRLLLEDAAAAALRAAESANLLRLQYRLPGGS